MKYLVNNILKTMILCLALLPAPSVLAFSEFRDNVATGNPEIVPFIIGGFDLSRGGDGGSIQYGANFSEARNSIALNLPNFTFRSFSTLTSDVLSGIGILFISSTYTGYKAISPLTADEQQVLLNYIQNGGCAMILTDHDSFGGIPASREANQSLLTPFHITTAGTISGEITATVMNPLDSLITNGSYGIVPSFLQNYPGYFMDEGIYANRLASNGMGGALDIINADVIQVGSGPVIFYSDANAFWDEEDYGYFLKNENLFMNSIHSCYIRSSTPLYTISGRVTDSDANGIPGVVVYADKRGRTTTDALGYFQISALPSDRYNLEPYKTDFVFEPSQKPINVPPDAEEQNFVGKIVYQCYIPLISMK